MNAIPAWRPGDERPDTEAMIRVDQAGEYGATRIYAGQLAALGARPTLLQPVWNVAGYWLGAATALMGPSAAMACTAAIETEIDKHYSEQLRALGGEEPDLAGTIETFRQEELEHRDTAIEAGAETAFGYPLLSGFIRAGCRLAIELSKRI